MLAIGLIAAGVGTGVLLRNVQIAALDQNLRQLAPTDVTSTLFDIDVVDETPTFTRNQTTATQFYVAVYGPDGELVVSGGGGTQRPDVPKVFSLEKTVLVGTEPFELSAVNGGAKFHAAVDILPPIPGVRDSYTQLVALPLSSVNQTVANYVGIYTIFVVLTMVAGALLTRWLVTLAFRSLGEVEETAMSIAAGNFSQRMGDSSTRTEVGRLKTAINAMLDRIDHALGQRDASVRQMRRFIGDASHELRTPLVTVRGYAELYRMGAISGDEQIAQSMERIEKEAVRMGALVEDLLALARLDERRDIIIVDVDLRPIARDAVLDTRVTAPGRTVTMVDETLVLPPLTEESSASQPAESKDTSARGRRSATLADATRSILRRRPRPASGARAPEETTEAATPAPRPLAPPIVLGDENRIRQVVTNLLTNARRYTPDDSPIEIAVGVDERAGMGWIAVIDHGEGIPEMIRDKIFQRFWRADTSRTRETGGSGLGLSIVASIVEALHGAIDVVETPGGGATFRVSFPLAQARPVEEHLLIETQPLPRFRES